MGYRWVLCPVVLYKGGPGKVPKPFTLVDPGREPAPGGEPKTYRVAGPLHPGKAWTFTFVRFVDSTNLDADPSIVTLLEQDQADGDNLLAKTVAELGWSNAKLNRIKNRLVAKGVTIPANVKQIPLWKILRELGRKIDPDWPGPRGCFSRQ